jgi:membrane protein YdbS with pleckstrin-like domain
MAFPTRLLIQGEELILDLRPHWIALARATLVTLVVVVAEIVAAANLNGVAVWIALGAGILVLLWWPVRDVVHWATSHFVVTSDRVIHRQGLIAKNSMEIPLEAINDVRFHQGVFERVIGAGDLIIQSASESGREVFGDIRHPEEVQKTIYQQGEHNQKRMYQGMGSGSVAPSSNSAGAPSTTAELQRLGELRDKGVLTESEFQNQKKKILGDG